MKQKIYQVDAFAEAVFSGNPAAVCPLKEWLSNEIMQKIAAENNLAETAFYVQNGQQFEIRWFTPAVEVDLCGHATLAAAYVLFNQENYTEDEIEFYSHRSGILKVRKDEDMLTLNFPVDTLEPLALSADIINCFASDSDFDTQAGTQSNTPSSVISAQALPIAAYKGKTDYILIFETESDIQNCQPDFTTLAKLKARGVIVTAPGNEVDFVSRFFAPQVGILEDPVTGSAHTTLIPYWAERLGKTEMSAIQLSERRGHLQTKHLKDRVEISGKGKLYLIGEIYLA